jgi:hypothetical protein
LESSPSCVGGEEAEFQTERGRKGFENAAAGGDNFTADAVAGDKASRFISVVIRDFKEERG